MSERFQPTKRSEQRYYSNLLRVLRRFFSEGQEWTARLLSIPEWFDALANAMALEMITYQSVENARSWREAARISGRGSLIYARLQQELRGPVGERVRELVRENANLIKSLPLEISEQVTAHAARAAQEGRRFESSERSRLLSHVSRTRARLIARTETAKAQAALTQARAEELDLPWYVWRTSEDERVRLSHRKMAAVLVRYDVPPSPERLAGEKRAPGPYNAGEIWNCRCYAEPLLRLNQVQWPHKVYADGRIQITTLAAFRRLNGLEAVRMAA